VLFETKHVENTLLAEGLIRPGTTVRAIQTAASMMNAVADFELDGTELGTFVVTEKTRGVADRITIEARRATQRYGCGRPDDIVSLVKDSLGVEMSQEAVRGILSILPGISWLGDDRTWFWFSTVRQNRLLNSIDKALAIAGEINVGELRSAIRRHHRMDHFAPPRRILLALCAQLNDCEVVDERIKDNGGRTLDECLSDTEQTLRRLILEHGPAIHWRHLEHLALKAGVNRATFQMCIFNSPIFRRLAKGVYGLVGTQVAPGAVQSAVRAPAHRRSKVLQDWGWKSDEVVWVDYRLSAGCISNGTLTVPSGARSLLVGSFVAVIPQRLGVVTLRVRGSRIGGLLGYFAREEPEPGDFVRIEFDLHGQQARIHLSSEPFEEAEDSPTAILVG